MTAIIWSKDLCPYCREAKNLLKSSGIVFEERNISGPDWTKEQLFEVLPDVKTVPQIFLHGTYVGDYSALLKYYEDHNMWAGNEGT